MVPVWVRPWLLTALICYTIFAVYWYLFVGYAHGWEEQPQQRLDTKLAEPVDWDTLEVAAAGDDVLLSVASNGRDGEVEACTRDGACRKACRANEEVAVGDTRPVLNCLVSVPDVDDNDRAQQIERLMRQRDPLGLSYLLRGTGSHLSVVARLQGNAEAMHCGRQGHCYLIAELPDISNKTVFVSTDFGHHWRVAAQDVLEKAYVPKVIGVDGERVWVDGYRRVYLSVDGGESWRVLADDDRLIAYDSSVIDGASHSDTMSDLFNWRLDDAGQLYATTGDRYDDASDTAIYRMNARTGEIISASRHDGSFSWLENGPGGQLFGIYRTDSPSRYAVYRLRKGEWAPVLVAGSHRLRSLRANARTLIVEKGRGDGTHLLMSQDGGQHWAPMADIRVRERMKFDPTDAGWLRLGYRNREGYYGYRWIRPSG